MAPKNILSATISPNPSPKKLPFMGNAWKKSLYFHLKVPYVQDTGVHGGGDEHQDHAETGGEPGGGGE